MLDIESLPMRYNTAVSSGDLALSNLKLGDANWLKTAVYTSLFTNKQHPESSEQGYWGDAFSEQSYGSLLYTLRREKLYAPTLVKARDIAAEALAWLTPEYVQAVDVRVEALQPITLKLYVTLTLNDGERLTLTEEYSLAVD